MGLVNVRSTLPSETVAETGDTIRKQLFPAKWLQHNSIEKITSLAVLGVNGDSMSPTLRHGDQTLADMSERNCVQDGIYVLQLGDTQQIKRLSVHPTTKKINTFNPRKKH